MTCANRRGLLPRVVAAFFLMALIAAAGCNKQAAPKIASDTAAFDSASADVKDQWNKILAAAASNDYATAILGCRKLTATPDITTEQRAAANTTFAAVSQKMFDAAQKGDAAAQQAVQDVRKGWR
jgi:hypothetical protein